MVWRQALWILIVLMAACGSPGPGADPSDRASPEDTASESGQSQVEPCELLTDEELTALASGPVGSGSVSSQPLPKCEWTGEGGARIQVLSARAGRWSRTLPAIIEQLLASDALDPEDREELESAQGVIAQTGALPDEEACALFTRMAEIGGAPAGSAIVTQYVPNAEAPQAVAAQMCADARFTSVVLADEGLAGSPERATGVTAAAEEAHARALAAGA